MLFRSKDSSEYFFFEKGIVVNTNMKKHNRKKQGIVESISNRNCMKERKTKLKEMIDIVGNKATTTRNA